MKIRHRQTRTIRHAELTALLATYGEISPTAAKRLIAVLINCMGAALSFGHTVQVHKLGTFRPVAAKQHKAFDTQRLASESYRIQFKASAALLKSMKQADRLRNARKAYQQPRPDPSYTNPVYADPQD